MGERAYSALYDDDEIDIIGGSAGLSQEQMPLPDDLDAYGIGTHGLEYSFEITQPPEDLLGLAPGSPCPTVMVQDYDNSSGAYSSGQGGFPESGFRLVDGGHSQPSQAAQFIGENSYPLDIPHPLQTGRSRQGNPSEPWTAFAVGQQQQQQHIPYRYGSASIGSSDNSTQSLSGYHAGCGTLETSLATASASPGTSMGSGIVYGGAASSYDWQQPTLHSQATPAQQSASLQMLSSWNGLVSDESYSGMAIDSTSVGQGQRSRSLSRYVVPYLRQ